MYTGHTFIILEVQSILFISHDLLHIDDALVVELPKDFDLPDSRDGKALFLVV